MSANHEVPLPPRPKNTTLPLPVEVRRVGLFTYQWISRNYKDDTVNTGLARTARGGWDKALKRAVTQ